MTVDYFFKLGSEVVNDADFVRECSDLFSGHYGKWADNALKNSPGQQIRLSVERIVPLLRHPRSSIAYARISSKLVGYAIAIRDKAQDGKVISWVTQLVVHTDHRQRRIATNILQCFWCISNDWAWGIISANPCAIRTLEKATRRRCQPELIGTHSSTLMDFASGRILYVARNTDLTINSATSVINTNFWVSHDNIPSLILKATETGNPWALGDLPDGWEWFAFTFNEQKAIELSHDEVSRMLALSDNVAVHAYERMTYSEQHQWASHAEQECDLIVEFCKLEPGNKVLDLGCGTGRHANILASKEFNVVGVDNAESVLHKAKNNSTGKATFRIGDCRTLDLQEQFDAVTCLYDVIGSHAAEEDNCKILDALVRHLRPGGYALLSVMNMELTNARAKHFFSFRDDPNKLQDLKPSDIMEKTGNVFNPEYYMIDTETKIVYRKEQFTRGQSLPTEMVVRDRRYTTSQISTMCNSAGLEVVWLRCVKAGDWMTNLNPTNEKAKEILVCCRKPLA